MKFFFNGEIANNTENWEDFVFARVLRNKLSVRLSLLASIFVSTDVWLFLFVLVGTVFSIVVVIIILVIVDRRSIIGPAVVVAAGFSG